MSLKKCFLEEKLIVYLMQMKITPNLKGYTYIKEAALRVCENSSKKRQMTNVLFKELAEEFGEKPSLLDRALRHAIEVSFKRNGIHDLERMISVYFTEKKPSPKEIICILAEKLNLDLYQEFMVE